MGQGDRFKCKRSKKKQAPGSNPLPNLPVEPWLYEYHGLFSSSSSNTKKLMADVDRLNLVHPLVGKLYKLAEKWVYKV